MIVYEIKNLGRRKWCGEVKAQTDAVEHVEAALMKVAHKNLMSRDIDFMGDVDRGQFIVGMGRVVGEYWRKGEGQGGEKP